MYPHVQNMVDGLAKQKMKEKPVAELCSFQNAVTTADGARLTRGHHSQNFAYQVRDYLTGALLYYQHLCQRGKDHLCEDNIGSLILLLRMAILDSKSGATWCSSLSQCRGGKDHASYAYSPLAISLCLASRPITVVFGLGTRLRVRLHTKLENSVLSNRQQQQSVVVAFSEFEAMKTLSGYTAPHCDKDQFRAKMTVST